jgi:hypothetical protein
VISLMFMYCYFRENMNTWCLFLNIYCWHVLSIDERHDCLNDFFLMHQNAYAFYSFNIHVLTSILMWKSSLSFHQYKINATVWMSYWNLIAAVIIFGNNQVMEAEPVITKALDFLHSLFLHPHPLLHLLTQVVM